MTTMTSVSLCKVTFGLGIAVCIIQFADSAKHNQGSSAGTGSLPFLEVDFSKRLPKGDDESKQIIYMGDDIVFPFGDVRDTMTSLYISTNGYFSVGNSSHYNSLPPIPLSHTLKIIAPFALDYNTSNTSGSVKYTVLDDKDRIKNVSEFIREKSGNKKFYGEWAIVAEWYEVRRQGSTTNNTFQAVLITDEMISYGIYIYKCGSMEEGDAIIGWQFNESWYASYPESEHADNNKLVCSCGEDYCAVFYLLSDCDSLRSAYITCDNNKCVGCESRCDGVDNCGDNSDEKNCASTKIGLYLEIGAGFVFLGVILFCLLPVCYCLGKKRKYAKILDSSSSQT